MAPVDNHIYVAFYQETLVKITNSSCHRTFNPSYKLRQGFTATYFSPFIFFIFIQTKNSQISSLTSARNSKFFRI